jgi:hypothetical protein
MKWFNTSLLTLAISLLTSVGNAQALGPVVTTGCVARWNAVTTSGGVPLTSADGVISYKIYVSPTATTGGPVAPPPGSTVTLAAGTSAPICPNLIAGQQYSYWTSAVNSLPAPGLPSEGPPSAPFPFTMATPPPISKTPDAPTGATMTP